MEQWLASSWLANNVVDCSNIVSANLRAHMWNGIALCILTLIHVWSILLPCLTHKWKAQVVPGIFEWPLSERAPTGFKDANPDTKTMSLQVDDVFRMVEMTLLLGVLVPLSVKWMTSNYHLGIHVHRFVMVLYFVDIVRRHSHPHSWALNTPIFVIWILDKIWSLVWRRVRKNDVIREKISNDYIILYWNDIENYRATGDVAVGSNYLMKLYPSSSMENRHPFTTFHNRAGIFDFMADNKSGNVHFTHAAVIRVFGNERTPLLGGDSKSHTSRLAKENLERLSIWGPFQGKMTALIPKLLQKSHFDSKNRRVVFVGTGSAVNFLLDVVSFLSKAIEHIETDIVILFSTRDEVLHDWVFRAMSNILKLGIERSMQTGNSGIKVLLALTGRTHSCDLKNTMHTVSMEREPSFDVTTSSISMCVCDGNPTPSKPGMIEVLYNHIDYGREIQDHSVVFCQVSTVIKEFVRKVCLSKDEVEFYMN